MNLFKKHVDTVIILGGILAAVTWMNAQFNQIEKELAVMKAVLIMRQIMPTELAAHEKIMKENL